MKKIIVTVAAICLLASICISGFTTSAATTSAVFKNGPWKIISEKDELPAGVTLGGKKNSWKKNVDDLIANPADSAFGRGNALKLGAKGHVKIDAGCLDGAKGFTFSAWIYWLGPDLNTGSLHWQRIFDFGFLGDSPTESAFYLTPLGSLENTAGSGTFDKIDGMTFGIYNIPKGVDIFCAKKPQTGYEATALDGAKWVNVACTLDGSKATLYLNGEVFAQVACTFTPGDVNPTSLLIGKSQKAGDPYLNAALDDVYIHNKALSQAEIKTLAGLGDKPSTSTPSGSSSSGSGSSSTGNNTSSAAPDASTPDEGDTSSDVDTGSDSSDVTDSSDDSASSDVSDDEKDASGDSPKINIKALIIIWSVAGALLLAGGGTAAFFIIRSKKLKG